MPPYLEKEYNVMCVQRDNMEQLEKCDLLILEMKKEELNEILKWVFYLDCRKKIPILAITNKYSNTEKLLLSKFGIMDYVDEQCGVQEIQHKLDSMIRRINWKRQINEKHDIT
ncbi:MAG: hypothetical protein ACFWTK_07225 [Clostridium sp.]